MLTQDNLKKNIYLDYASSSPLLPSVKKIYQEEMCELYGNPSSQHMQGQRVSSLIENARSLIASVVSIREECVFFSSGATEIINQVIHIPWRKVFYSYSDHPAVQQSVRRYCKDNSVIVPLDGEGRLCPIVLKEILKKHGACEKDLFIVTIVNSITGNTPDVKQIIPIIQSYSPFIFLDSVQDYGKFFVSKEIYLLSDFFIGSGHKIGAGYGAGVLCCSKRGKKVLKRFIHGGSQEMGYRSGTPSVYGIIGLGKATSWWEEHRENQIKKSQIMKEKIIFFLEEKNKKKKRFEILSSRKNHASPFILCISDRERETDAQIILMDMHSVHVSGGYACTSNRSEYDAFFSYFLLEKEILRGIIRLSFGWNTDFHDMHRFLSVLSEGP